MKRIDKIRQMSSEELARVLIRISNCVTTYRCEECLLGGSAGCGEPDIVAKWLEEEVQEDA